MELLAPEKRRAVRMIREELCCKLCTRVFEDPHCLDCKHNFCRECIFLHLRKSESACPKCKLPTRPSEITKNQFLQSILSAWKAVETSLAPLEDPDSAALLDKQERERLEEEELAAQRRHEQQASERNRVAHTKWQINTFELKQEAEAAERRANAIEMFGGSLVERAALKNAALKNTALEAKNTPSASAPASASASTVSHTTTPVRRIKANGFGAAHFKKMMNGRAASPARNNGMSSSQTQDDVSQTQMPHSELLSPLAVSARAGVRRQSPFSPSETPSPGGTSLSSMSSPFSMMATQDIHGYVQKIQAQNQFLDEWPTKATTSTQSKPIMGFGAKHQAVEASNGTETRSVPTISAVQRMQELMAAGAAATLSVNKRSPGKRKRQIFSAANHSDMEVEEEDDDPTQMTSTLADSPDLLGFGGVAPPVAVNSAARRQSLVAPKGAAASRLSGAREDSSDEDGVDEEEEEEEEEDDDQGDETWVERPSKKCVAPVKAESPAVQRDTRRRMIVPSSQAPHEVVDMTQDDDEDDDEEVDDSQVPVSALGSHPPVKKKRVSEDFHVAISTFKQGQSTGHLHRLSGANESEVDSPRSDPMPAPVPAASLGISKGVTNTTASAVTLASRTSSVKPAQPLTSTRPPLAAATTNATKSTAVRGKGRVVPPSSVNYAFVGTDLSKDEIKSVIMACSRLGGRFGRDFDIKREPSGALTTSVTHLITQSVPVTTSDGGEHVNLGLRCKRTAKYMRALAEGTYVVDYSWVQASLAHGAWLPEAKYEMSGDIYSDAVGKPRESRLRRIRTGNRNDIFRAFQFVLLCPEKEFDFHLESLRAIIVNFGARVEMARSGGNHLVNALPESPRGKTNLGIVSKTMEPLEARRLWDIYQIPIVRVTWIFDSISHLEVLPFDDYYPY